jgi:predicted Zn-dependent protease
VRGHRQRVLGFSNADACRVSVSSGMRQNSRFAVNQISTAGDNYNVSVSIRSVFGKKVANVSVNRLDEASLRARSRTPSASHGSRRTTTN